MAVLNPPRVIPGLGRSISTSSSRTGALGRREFVERSASGVNDDGNSADGVRNTLSAFRAIGIIESGYEGSTVVASSVAAAGRSFDRTEFRRLMLRHVFDLDRDGDPWSVPSGEGLTSGARDLSRALSWFLAQDALENRSSWRTTSSNCRTPIRHHEDDRCTVNDTRWNASPLGSCTRLATPSVGDPSRLDSTSDNRRWRRLTRCRRGDCVFEFLDLLSDSTPSPACGVIRKRLATRLRPTPIPAQAHAVDASLAQVFRILRPRSSDSRASRR